MEREAEDRPSAISQGPRARRIEGFINRVNHNTAGIRVNLSHDRQSVGIAFTDDKLPTREEKDKMQMAGFAWREPRRQWERPSNDPVNNEIDARDLAKQMADARSGREPGVSR
jgi:hypothetical protein